MVNAVCPLTLYAPTPPAFVVVSSPTSMTFQFDAPTLMAYFNTTGTPRQNPITRQPLTSVELLRLQRVSGVLLLPRPPPPPAGSDLLGGEPDGDDDSAATSALIEMLESLIIEELEDVIHTMNTAAYDSRTAHMVSLLMRKLVAACANFEFVVAHTVAPVSIGFHARIHQLVDAQCSPDTWRTQPVYAAGLATFVYICDCMVWDYPHSGFVVAWINRQRRASRWGWGAQVDRPHTHLIPSLTALHTRAEGGGGGRAYATLPSIFSRAELSTIIMEAGVAASAMDPGS
jgi:hypothetical protein